MPNYIKSRYFTPEPAGFVMICGKAGTHRKHRNIAMDFALKAFAVLIILCLMSVVAPADDSESNLKFQKGLEAIEARNYYGAAKRFLDAEFLADTVSLKAKAVQAAVEAYRKANVYYKEFECIEKLLNSYPALVNYPALVDREYEIGDLFFAGHRDPAYWPLRWIPWLKGEDRSEEIYSKALKHAPFAQSSPLAKLRLSALLIDRGKPQEAMPHLREIIEKHSNSKVCKFAYLELGTALFELSQRGDGDGKYNQECVRVMKEFVLKFPDASERDWAEKIILKSKDTAAERILGMARFYDRINRPDPAERYLNSVLQKYPDTEAAEKSEELLVKMDKTFAPEAFRPEIESRIQTFPNVPIPEEHSELLVVPENSDGKWLLPIRDLGLDKAKEYRKGAEN